MGPSGWMKTEKVTQKKKINKKKGKKVERATVASKRGRRSINYTGSRLERAR
jgi:hypothetical protein